MQYNFKWAPLEGKAQTVTQLQTTKTRQIIILGELQRNKYLDSLFLLTGSKYRARTIPNANVL